MSTNEAVLTINAMFGQRAAAEVEGLEAKCKASMRAVRKENWIETEEDGLFRAAIGGVLLDLPRDSEDAEKVKATLAALQKFSATLAALQAGISVNFEESLPEDTTDLLPLMAWWRQVKAEER